MRRLCALLILFVGSMGIAYLILPSLNAIITPLKAQPITHAYDDSELRQRIGRLERIVGLKGELAQPTGLQHRKK